MITNDVHLTGQSARTWLQATRKTLIEQFEFNSAALIPRRSPNVSFSQALDSKFVHHIHSRKKTGSIFPFCGSFIQSNISLLIGS